MHIIHAIDYFYIAHNSVLDENIRSNRRRGAKIFGPMHKPWKEIRGYKGERIFISNNKITFWIDPQA